MCVVCVFRRHSDQSPATVSRLHGMQNYQNRQSRQISPAQFFEKILHQRGTLPGEYPCRHLRLRMKQLAARRGISPFRIGSPVYDTPHLRPSSSSRTHHAGFNGHIKRTFVQVFPPCGMHGCRQGLHLGMRRRVTERFDEVMPPAHYPARCHDHGADRHLFLT